MKNWGGNVEFAGEIARPTSVDELAELVAASDIVRPIGTTHSFAPVNDAPGAVLVSTSGLGGEVEWEGDSVWVPSGTRYGDAVPALVERGRALGNMGSLPHISVGGAVAAGTHGSGDAHRVLAASVSAVELVDGRGERVVVDRSDARFPGVPVALGLLGVVTRLRLETVPAYEIAQDLHLGLPTGRVLEQIDDVFRLGYSVSVFTDWVDDARTQVLVKRRPEDDADAATAMLGVAPLRGVTRSPDGGDGDNTTRQGGVFGLWFERLPHFRLDRTPSAGEEIQTEYFVAREVAAEALAAVHRVAPEFRDALIITELRSVASDDLWLSPAYGRDSVGIHFTWRLDPEGARRGAAIVEQALEPFAARPHLGKFTTYSAERRAASVQRLDDFAALAREFDPQGRFRHGYAAELLG